MDLFEHLEFQRAHRRLCDIAPDIVAKEEQLILLCVRFGDVEVAADQWYQKRVENKIEEFVEEFPSFFDIRLGRLMGQYAWRCKPVDVGNLETHQPSSPFHEF